MNAPLQTKTQSPQFAVTSNKEDKERTKEKAEYTRTGGEPINTFSWQNSFGNNPNANESVSSKISHSLNNIPIHASKSVSIQPKLTINTPGDQYEQEADAMADKVMRMPVNDQPIFKPSPLSISRLRRKCAHCEEEEKLQRKENALQPLEASGEVSSYIGSLSSKGSPMPESARSFFEPRFGHDFSNVRIHHDSEAAKSSQAVNAHAYTFGNNIVFNQGRFSPESEGGKRLLAHELVHVVQQKFTKTQTLNNIENVQRMPGDTMGASDGDIIAEREYGDSGAPKAQTCGRPAHCPPGFCSPYRSAKLAEYYRAKNAGWILLGISAAVDSKVVPLWREHINGGSPPKNLTASFASDFTNSPTTKKVTGNLYKKIAKALDTTYIDKFSTKTLNVETLIPAAVASLDDPADSDRMNFSLPNDIPGNIAGDIGKDQLSCPSGAQPSSFNDERLVKGYVSATRLTDSEITVIPVLTYTVKDTIDLCPGDCGALLEQIATIPISQFEATGISGDVPFTVEFAAPFLGKFTIPAPKKPTTP